MQKMHFGRKTHPDSSSRTEVHGSYSENYVCHGIQRGKLTSARDTSTRACCRTALDTAGASAKRSNRGLRFATSRTSVVLVVGVAASGRLERFTFFCRNGAVREFPIPDNLDFDVFLRSPGNGRVPQHYRLLFVDRD